MLRCLLPKVTGSPGRARAPHARVHPSAARPAAVPALPVCTQGLAGIVQVLASPPPAASSPGGCVLSGVGDGFGHRLVPKQWESQNLTLLPRKGVRGDVNNYLIIYPLLVPPVLVNPVTDGGILKYVD